MSNQPVSVVVNDETLVWELQDAPLGSIATRMAAVRERMWRIVWAARGYTMIAK